MPIYNGLIYPARRSCRPAQSKRGRQVAICQGRVPGEKNEVYLFYCAAEWSIERVQIWKSPQSTELIRAHAETLYAGGAAKWVRQAELRLLPSPW